MQSVVVLGTVVYDQILTARNSIQENTCNKMNCQAYIGGSMHNVAWNLASLKQETHFITKLGNDDLALYAQNNLEKKGCFIYGPIINLPTPRFYLIQDTKRTELFSTISEDFYYRFNDPLYISAIEHCTWGITDNQDEKLLASLFAKTPKTHWIFNGSIPALNLIHQIDGIILNENEMQRCCLNQQEEYLDKLFSLGLKWLILTRAEKGATLYVSHGAYDYPINTPANSLNSLGCGDAFSSGVLFALLKQKKIKEACEIGIKASQLVLSVPGALSDKITDLLDE